MRDLFQEQLNELKRELTMMGAACEEIIALASQALTDWNEELVQKVNTIGAQIDESERTIETICMKLLLRQQPVARDLRQISAAMKMITDMERIGDQAEDIVEIVPYMNAHPDEKFPKIREMAKAAQTMVTDAIDAYVKQDLELAKKVMAHDDVVDNYFTQIKKFTIFSSIPKCTRSYSYWVFHFNSRKIYFCIHTNLLYFHYFRIKYRSCFANMYILRRILR